jgi:cytidylate kinase
MKNSIAIDGPVASGKTVVGRLLARRLGYKILDTGLMYRAITWQALEDYVDFEDSTSVVLLLQKHKLDVAFDDEGQAAIRIDGQDVTKHLRLQSVEQMVSRIARIREVRDAMVALQRNIGRQGQVVMVGRDIGTIVLPDAKVKVYLTAAVEERARRRHTEMENLGMRIKYKQVLRDLEQRDSLDFKREIAPLRPAEDATEVVTDGLNVEDVVERVVSLLGKRK